MIDWNYIPAKLSELGLVVCLNGRRFWKSEVSFERINQSGRGTPAPPV
jgi:hypothetical protein